MYAWSRILYGAEIDDKGNNLGAKAFEINEDVSQDALGADDDEWQSLVDGGVVRDYRMPDDLQSATESPRQIMQAKLTAAQEGYNQSGPTDELLRRFDDDANVVPPEEINAQGEVTPAPDPNQEPQNQGSGLPQ